MALASLLFFGYNSSALKGGVVVENQSLILELDIIERLLKDAQNRLARLTTGKGIGLVPAGLWLLDKAISKILDTLQEVRDKLAQEDQAAE